ncbi:MAG: hypothetical protein OXD46_16720 [Chloroflexi bacterium]|nr:hypothetical protein [Chloroflexota bacterium]
MDSSLVGVVDDSWWKIILIIATLAFATIAVKITFKFDINKYLKRGRKAKKEKERRNFVEDCRHGWTLYHASPYSQCNLCMAFIATAVLLNIRKLDIRPPAMILAESHTIIPKPAKGAIFVASYMGRED